MPYKRAYKKRPAKKKNGYKKNGLNKTEKKQVAALVNKKAETKYLQPEYNLVGQGLKYQSDTAANQEIMVRAFTAGPGGLAVQNETYGFESTGGAARTITPIHMSRTFDSSLTGVPAVAYGANIPDGKYINPSMCRCVWRLHRSKVDTSDAEQERSAMPYTIRFIHVRPRQTKYSDTTLQPKTDLFVNNYGVAYGVESASNNYQQNFGVFEMKTAQVNKRKYMVLQDTICNIAAPSITTQLSTDLITTITANTMNEKFFTTNFKQPAKLYYEGVYDTETSREPLAGQASDMVFIHVGVLGTTTKSIPLDLKIDCKPISTFRDI